MKTVLAILVLSAVGCAGQQVNLAKFADIYANMRGLACKPEAPNGLESFCKGDEYGQDALERLYTAVCTPSPVLVDGAGKICVQAQEILKSLEN